jgi:hypothetical protein
MTDPLNPGDPGGAADQDQTDGGDLTAYRTGAMTSQSDIDKAKIRYGSALGSNYRAEETGWDGLTKEQEIQQEHLWRDRAIAEAEYEEQMQEVRARADAMIARLDEEERQCREKLKEVQKRPIILQDGRVVEPDKNGQFITDQTGRALTDTERAEAERQQHKKEADERALDDQLAQIDEAKNHIRKAQALASQGGANLTPEQMKQNEAQAQHELATAQTITQKQTHYETSTDASSTLTSTDTLAALGLGGPPERTTSFSASLDKKDSRSAVLQNQFTGAVQGTPTPPPDDQAPAGNTVSKTQIVQPNQ